MRTGVSSNCDVFSEISSSSNFLFNDNKSFKVAKKCIFYDIMKKKVQSFEYAEAFNTKSCSRIERLQRFLVIIYNVFLSKKRGVGFKVGFFYDFWGGEIDKKTRWVLLGWVGRCKPCIGMAADVL